MRKLKKLSAVLLPFLLTACMTAEEKASVGIIGGADGPTAVFVASRVIRPMEIAVYLLVIAALVGLSVWLILRRRRK